MSAQQPRDGIETLQSLEPLSALAPEQLEELLTASEVDVVRAGTTIGTGSPARAVYLLRGAVEVQPADGAGARVIRAGTDEARRPIGEQVRSAVAITTSALIRIDAELLDRLLTWAQISVPEEDVVMSERGVITVNKGDWLQTMRGSRAFRTLPAANIEELLYRLEPVIVDPGDVVIRQGDAGDYFYMIDDGVALVTHNPDNDEDCIEIAELGKGDTFGEAALLSDKPRNATVSMMSEGVLLRLSKSDFDKLLREPTLAWLNLAEARRRVADGAIWIDVRMPSEYGHGHLPGALNAPMPLIHRAARELDASKRYVCYCQSGRRSSAAAFVLKSYGLDASVLTGGLEGVPEDLLTTARTG